TDMQKSQENGQKSANTDTGTERVQKKPGIQSQSQEKSTFSQLRYPFSVKKRRQGLCYYSSSLSSLPRVKSKGFHKLKGKKDNSWELVQHGRVKTSFKASYWWVPKKNHTWILRKHKRKGYFTLDTLSKKAQVVSITDCHAGNPCELRYDPTAHRWHPMIEE
ncbi:hypothetical protein Tco_1261399, partial [Tanacetum coccineum]